MNVIIATVLILAALCLTAAAVLGFRRYYGYIRFYISARNRYRYIVNVCDMWLSVYQKGLGICGFLKNRNISRIVIYGSGTLGVRLYFELEKDDDIKVTGIVKNSYETDEQYHITDIPVFDTIEEADTADTTVIVTEFFNYKEVCAELKTKNVNSIYSLDEILQTLLSEQKTV